MLEGKLTGEYITELVGKIRTVKPMSDEEKIKLILRVGQKCEGYVMRGNYKSYIEAAINNELGRDGHVSPYRSKEEEDKWNKRKDLQ